MQQHVDMDGAVVWIVVQDVLRQLVDRGLMTWDEVEVLIASAKEKARQQVGVEQKAERLRAR